LPTLTLMFWRLTIRDAMKVSGVLSALLCSILGCPLWLGAQTSEATSAPTKVPEVYPDEGYLSPTRYVNRYFGFAFDIPSDLQLEPVPQQVPHDGRIQILQLGGPAPTYATVSIIAFPLHSKLALDAKGILRRALDQELYMGVEELHGLSKATLDGHLFYTYETRRGGDQHEALACNLEGHALVVMLGATNPKVVKELETAFEHVTFTAPAKVRELVGDDAEEYDGPSLSAHRLAQLQADPPANHIDTGRISGDMYENPQLGFRYPIPPGWTLEDDGAVLPAIERSRRTDFENPWMGAGERELMKVCHKTLFSAWAKRPAADGQLSYDDFGEVTVSAASMACFPGIRFPANPADHRAVQDFLLQLRLTHPVLQNMRDIRAFTSGGNVFVLLHGVVGFHVPDDELSRRLSIAMSVTARRGYILTWFFAAPHDSELRELLEEKITFHNGPPTQAASATKPGGGESQPAEPKPATAEAAEPGPPEVTSASSTSQEATADPASDSTAANSEQQDPPANSASSNVSAPRAANPGQEQQSKGQPPPPQ
jgi:hypothetical protein